MELKGKVALISGGGQGIGAGIVQRFLEEGARVAILQRGPLQSALQGHTDVIGIQVDLTDVSAIASAVDLAAAHFGRIDVLVNNAGIMFERSVAGIQPEELDLIMALNLRAPLFLAQAALPHLKRSGGGSIINIGSIEGIAANPGHTAYSAGEIIVLDGGRTAKLPLPF
ncbi:MULTISPECIES: SDR family NAD(P)-dependent oxidoreductase [Arthrobacter]|uniref:SDR family NAD(P)-dependent oxidoreductase n=1 Tax=Arthrobacter terricola TaxID=2547396 RepID=A0A4R5KBS3_9MICC|nr:MULTISPECIES: SDR family NAD(P)-dependent oxidoreductase [Arthrobacter]MBT8161775.1 SDR family NAD(P)-dependent oxidoreductase [Arthrobacter sp. GN70]TDF92659.1 SDR family NAD(P)-dependent oxidoreductase [Arthrobacter terricola]